MSKLSTSPSREKQQANRYVKRCEDREVPVNEDYIKLFETMDLQRNMREADPEWSKNNLEYDLRTTDWILKKARDNLVYAQNLYAAMCNNDFVRNDTWPILSKQTWSCSWRYAGGIIADMLEKGDYLDWYCSGIQGMEDDSGYIAHNNTTGKVGEGVITDEIREDLFRLGWLVVNEEKEI